MSRHPLRLFAALALVALTAPGALANGQGSYEQVASFGDNPGGLKMYLYTPTTLAANPGVVFALHGCTSSAADYRSAGWEELADEHGFYVVYPQTTSSNNPAMCFNWAGDWGNFAPIERGQDENRSIVSMAEHMESLGVDGGRIYATGHSSGAAMVVVLLATWPDVFAAGATIGGIPYKCPGSYGEVFNCMSPGKNLEAAVWGQRAKSGYPDYAGPYPPLQVWHGTSDTIVAPMNRGELVEQWTALHGADATADVEEHIGSATRTVFRDGNGDIAVESYLVEGQPHVVFVDPDQGCGKTGTYFKDANICSTKIIADFFDLTGATDPGPGPGEDVAGPDVDAGGTTDTASPDTQAPPADTQTPPADTQAPPADTQAPPADTGSRPDTSSPNTNVGNTDTSTGGDTGLSIPLPDGGHTCQETQPVASLGCSGASALDLGLALAGLALVLHLRRRRAAAAAAVVLLSAGGCDIGVGGATHAGTCEPDEDTSGVLVPGDTSSNGGGNAACTAAVQARLSEVQGQLGGYSIEDAQEMRGAGNQRLEADYAGKYRDDLGAHPGCQPRASYGPSSSEPFSTDNGAPGTPGQPAAIPGYPCAAKEYTQTREDTSKAIVILFHGNSSGVTAWEPYYNGTLAGTEQSNLGGFNFMVDTQAREQLAGRLVAAGHRVIGFDARTDLVATLDDWDSASETGNPFMNTDHGWTVPMAQRLILAVMQQNPTRKVSLVGHSLGVTVIRDALRRLYVSYKRGDAGALNPFAHLEDVVLLSGANHGVSTGPLCNVFPHMRGKVCCEMGDRAAYVETYFHKPLNGPRDVWATPCADGSFAFGAWDQCEGNVVTYTTVTMVDIEAGEYQDEFVSEESSRIDLEGCVDNALIGLSDHDSSGYFFTGRPGFLASHFGSARSEAGLQLVVAKLAD